MAKLSLSGEDQDQQASSNQEIPQIQVKKYNKVGWFVGRCYSSGRILGKGGLGSRCRCCLVFANAYLVLTIILPSSHPIQNSFFDDLGATNEQQRPKQSDERRMNTETFGMAALHNPRRYGGRGRGGYRGGGGGGGGGRGGHTSNGSWGAPRAPGG